MKKSPLKKALQSLKNRIYPNRIKRRLFPPKVPREQVSATSSRSDLIRLIDLMKPTDVGHDVIRLGGDGGGGGYLVPDDLTGITACFSPSVASTVDFEEMLANRFGIQCFLADYSVEQPPIENDLFDFERKFLGTINDDRHMRLEDWIGNKLALPCGDDLLLQMDIEGAEYDVIDNTPAHVLKQFRILVVEFHDLELAFDSKHSPRLTRLFAKLAEVFDVAHIHPNNHSPIYHAHGIDVPSVMEVTYLRKDRARRSGLRQSLPHPLDRPNLRWEEDIVLQDVWYN